MHQIQVNNIHIQQFAAAIECLQGVIGTYIVIPYLSRDEDLFPRDAAVLYRLAYIHFVFVDHGCIDMAVAAIQGCAH